MDDYGKMYLAGTGKNIYYYINGEPVRNPQNTVVKSTDQLLVYYWTGSREEVAKNYVPRVAKTADEYNQKADPASCGSNTYGWLTPIAEPIHEWLENTSE